MRRPSAAPTLPLDADLRPADAVPCADLSDTPPRAAGWVAAATRQGWRIERADTARQRARGLLGRHALPPGHGLWLASRSVHTVGMRFAIDLVWLERDGVVARLDHGVVPGRVRACRTARGGVIEVAAGEGRALAELLAVGQGGDLAALLGA